MKELGDCPVHGEQNTFAFERKDIEVCADMRCYSYSAYDSSGSSRQGTVVALSKKEAIQYLEEEGLFPFSINESLENDEMLHSESDDPPRAPSSIRLVLLMACMAVLTAICVVGYGEYRFRVLRNLINSGPDDQNSDSRKKQPLGAEQGVTCPTNSGVLVLVKKLEEDEEQKNEQEQEKKPTRLPEKKSPPEMKPVTVRPPEPFKKGERIKVPKQPQKPKFENALLAGSRPNTRNQIPGDEMSRCVVLVRQAMHDAWKPPEKKDVGTRAALLDIQLDESGHIISYRIRQSSGSTIFDQSVLKAAGKVQSIRGLSLAYLRQYNTITVTFEIK